MKLLEAIQQSRHGLAKRYDPVEQREVQRAVWLELEKQDGLLIPTLRSMVDDPHEDWQPVMSPVESQTLVIQTEARPRKERRQTRREQHEARERERS